MSGIRFFGQMKPRQTWVRMMGREESKEEREQLGIQSISCVQHGGGGIVALARVAANGTGSLLTIDDVTADRSVKMNSEVRRVILSAHVQPNATKLIDWCFTV